MPPPPADTTAALALAETARRAQVKVRDAAVRDMTRLWAVLDFQRLRETWPVWMQGATAVLTRYHSQSADDAALFYRATRQVELGDPGHAVIADPLPAEQVARSLGYSGPGVYAKQIKQGAAPEQAKRAALTVTQGTTTRLVMDGSRSTIEESAKADPEPVGWYFKTDGDPCYFCALLASRGVVYHADSFVLSDVRFIGDGTAKVHNHCACVLAPAFSRNATLPDVNQEALKVYKDRGKGPALNAFRKAWTNRHAA